MTFNELEDWTINSKGASIRVIKGGDINNPDDMVAVIYNHPKVRVSSRVCSVHNSITIDTDKHERILQNKRYDGSDIWINGSIKAVPHQKNTYSRTWCDSFLSILGFN